MRLKQRRQGIWYLVLFLLVFGNALALWFFAQLLATRDVFYGTCTMLTGAGMMLGSWLTTRLGALE